MAQANRGIGGKLTVVVVLVVLAGLAVAGAVALTTNGGATAENSDQPTFSVRRGPLSITVVESGTIKPREQITIKSEVRGQNAILYLIEEGAMVEEGDLLIELDSSSLQDEKVEEQIRVQNAEAAFIRARENLAVVENQSASDISKAELELQFAKQDLEKYTEGEYPQQLMQAENDITIAEEELQRAEQKRQWSEVLYKEKYISQSELQADELAAKKARLDLEVAKTDLELLKQYTHPRDLAELRRDVEQKEMALERVQRKAKADIIQEKAELAAKESEYARQQDKLKDTEEQIGKTKIYAPSPGQVIYATSTQFSWRGNTEPLAEGQTVRERHELIYLPTTGTMIAEIKIHEASLDKIQAGLDVTLTVDALPGKRYSGKVVKVAPLPDPTHVFLNPDLKVYRTEVLLTEKDPALRAGMSCTARVLVKEFDDAMYVPIQAVIRVGGQPSVYVKQGNDFKRMPVEIGLDNGSMIRIVSGVEEGDEVMLAPPLDAASVSVTEEADAGGDASADGESRKSTGADRKRGGDEARSRSGDETRSRVGDADKPAEVSAETPADAGTAEADETDGRAEGRERRGGRPDFSNMSQEQIDAMRKRFENMSEEERREAIQKYRQQRGGE